MWRRRVLLLNAVLVLHIWAERSCQTSEKVGCMFVGPACLEYRSQEARSLLNDCRPHSYSTLGQVYERRPAIRGILGQADQIASLQPPHQTTRCRERCPDTVSHSPDADAGGLRSDYDERSPLVERQLKRWCGLG